MSKDKEKKEHKKRVKAVIEETLAEQSTVETAGQVAQKDVEPNLKEADDRPHPNVVKLFAIAFASMVFVAVISGAVYTYLNGVSSLRTEGVTPTSKPHPEDKEPLTGTPGPAPTLKEQVDLSVYKLVVLNGSGKIGVASQAKSDLAKAGFVSISTNNAGAFDFAETLVSAKESVPESVKSLVKGTLSKSYAVADGEALPPASGFDIEITLGSK